MTGILKFLLSKNHQFFTGCPKECQKIVNPTLKNYYYICIMSLHKKYTRAFFLLFTGIVALLILQSVWIYPTYQLEHNRLMTEIEEAFNLAYQKEQTYRVPVVDIVNPGEVSIQSCGSEEIIIVRKCFDPDTIVYNNLSGRSVENFIKNVFWDLREQIVPMNIHCFFDLFAGMLHDKDIPVFFVVERYNVHTGEILETSSLSDKDKFEMNSGNTVVIEISNTESIRAILKITPGVILGNMSGILTITICLIAVILFSIVFLYKMTKQTDKPAEHIPNDTFQIGKYTFNPHKNELQGFGETIQLNKKENSILYALCINEGNVVERNALLEENWGNSGMIYSRSLDTYLASLRKYLKKDPTIQIVTVKSVGYKLVYTE